MDYFRFSLGVPRYKKEIATPVYVSAPGHPRRVRCVAVWDTGATGTMISEKVANDLHLVPCGHTNITGVHGTEKAKQYKIDLSFSNGFVMPDICVAEASNGGGFDVLVGMDIIGNGALFINGASTPDGVLVEFAYPTDLAINADNSRFNICNLSQDTGHTAQSP